MPVWVCVCVERSVFIREEVLCVGIDLCTLPLHRREQFLQWVENLPDNQTPSWLGLPNNAEKVLLTNKGEDSYFSFMVGAHKH